MAKLNLLFKLNLLLLALFVIFSADTLKAQLPGYFNSREEVEAYKQQVLSKLYDADQSALHSPYYRPESTDDFELQLLVPLPGFLAECAIESDGENIYVGRFNSSTIDKYDLSGNFVESFTIGNVSNLSDFAWDGNRFYATDVSYTIYELDLANKESTGFINAPYPFRGIAYNDDEDIFYGSNFGEPIVAFDRQGNVIGEYNTGTFGAISGLAYDNESDGGPFLWGFSQSGATLVQYSLPDVVETGIALIVSDNLGLPEIVAGGLAFVDDLIPGTFSLLGILQGENIIAYGLGQTQIYDNDLAVTSIDSPVSGFDLTSSENVTVTVKNLGFNTQSNIPVSFSLDNGETFTEFITESLAQNESVSFTFNQTIDLSTPDQTYTIEVCVGLEGDEFEENNCKIKLVSHDTPFYCIPTSGCSFGDGFESFTLNSIENLNSGCSVDGYGDFTNMIAELLAGETYTLTWSSGYGTNFASLWIDLDQDLTFDAEERLIANYELEVGNNTYSTEITIPEHANEGQTTLRIRAQWIQEVNDPCEDYSFGETEDYSVFITNNPLTNNVGVRSLNFPGAIQAGELTPQITVKNFGTETQSFPVTLDIGQYSSTIQVDGLESYEERLVDFEIWNAEPGTYVAQACTQLAGDENTLNDCKSDNIIVISQINAYGYVNNDYIGQLVEGWVAFDLTDPGNLFQIFNSGLSTPIIGATYVGNKIYGVEYNGAIYVFDPQAGTQELLYNTPQYVGIAFDGADFYTCTYNQLFRFDISTGEASLIGDFGGAQLNYGIASIAIDGNGEMWGVDLAEDNLFFIDKETAEVTYIGPLGANFIYLLDISFDKSSNTLYFAGSQYSVGASSLYVINTETGEAIPIAPLQNGVHMSGLAIPNDASFIFPPRNLEATTTGNQVNLSWDAPYGGNVLQYNIYRDNQAIGNTQTLNFINLDLEIGIYTYAVTAVYENGESEQSNVVEVAVGNPEISTNPQSFNEILEMGEAVQKQLTIFNTGNLDLNFEISAFFNNPSNNSPDPFIKVSEEEYATKATERFGEQWQELMNESTISYSPQGTENYCIPAGNCNFGDGIANFKLASINNLNSGCSTNGYGDFTAQTTHLDAGATYELIASSGYHNNYLNVWVDLNKNEIFEESELLVNALMLETAGELYSTQITIPEGAPSGQTRLRAIGTWINPNYDPCSVFTFGETEDYTINIGGIASWISSDPQSGSVAPGDSAIVNITLDAAYLDPIEYAGSIEIASNDSSNLVVEIPVNLTVIEQGISNFYPIWETPFNPMSIFVVGAQLDSLDLDLGDEIGVFDSDPNSGEMICVGAGLVINPISSVNILEIIVSMDDGSNPDEANGFTSGNEMAFKIWNSLTGEVDDVEVSFPNPGFDEVFTPLGTAIVEISGTALIEQTMSLTQGWNLISSRAQPHNMNMMTIFQPMIDLNILEKVIDEDGGTLVYLPYPEPEGRWNNSIGNMEMTEGYYVRVSEDLSTAMLGLPIELPMDLPLETGWNIMGYPATAPQNALDIVMPLINNENLYKVIDQSGGVIQYVPFPEPNGQWINTIGDLQNGQGYYIKVFDETSLTIDEIPGLKTVKTTKGSTEISEYFEPVYSNNPFMPMHFILFTGGKLNAGDEVGIFDGDICVGASTYDGNAENLSITVTSMDDADTEIVDGYTSGHSFTLKVMSSGTLFEDVETEHLLGPTAFAPLESYVGEITQTITGLSDASTLDNSISVHPNPVVDILYIKIFTNESATAKIELFRTDGSKLKNVFDGKIQSGHQTIETKLNGLSPGIYLLKTELEGIGMLIKKVFVK